MDDSLLCFYNWTGLFYDDSFQGEALFFFQAVGHTSSVVPLVVAEDILHCIYTELNFNSYFDKNERSAFSCIESLSHLFTLDNKVFNDSRVSPQVRYYAISLNTALNERTVTANTILNAFAKNTSDYIVIMFRHEKMCMLSFCKKSHHFMTFFSDWFNETGVFDIASRINIGNLTLHSSGTFFFDFVFMAARSYFTYPLSRDYIYSEWCSTIFSADGEEEYARPSWSDYSTETIHAHIHEYGDDYIKAPDVKDYQLDIISDNDYDFGLLELELDELIETEVFEVYEDENEYRIDDEGDFTNKIERIDAKEIPSHILSDPVKLLEWLEKMSIIAMKDKVNRS